MKLTFTCPLPPTLNDQINAARNNKYGSNAIKQKWTELIKNLVLGSKKFDDKVWVYFDFQVKNFGRDPDNIDACQKYIMDGLKEAGTIKKDSLMIIQSPKIHTYSKGDDQVEVTVTDNLSDVFDFIESMVPRKPTCQQIGGVSIE